MTKKLSKIIIATILISIMVCPIHAIEPHDAQITTQAQPRWTNAASAVMKLDITSSPITAGFTICGHVGTTYSNGTFILEKISGSHTGVIATWTGLSASTPYFTFNEHVDAPLTAGQYRITLTITATNNGVSEVIELTKVSVR